MDNDFQALKQLILDKTQGTPFFMEEIVQELREQGLLTDPRRVGSAHQYLDLHLPTTVQAVLAARIDRLAPDEKALLQQLAVIGRQFPLSLIRQVITQPEADLYRLLASLQHKEFLYEQPAFPESEYLFKHALTQDVAYSTVLQEQKKLLHERTGQAIEQLFLGKVEEYYSELAHHYQRSGNVEKAVEYLQKAGQQAVQRSAYTEAIEQLNSALRLLGTLPDTKVHAQQELALQIMVGPVFIMTKGYTDPSAAATFQRAVELSERLDDATQRVAALLGIWRVCFSSANLLACREISTQVLELLQNAPDSPLLLPTYAQFGAAELFLGDPAHGRQLLTRGVALYDPSKHRPLVATTGIEVGMAAFSNLADVLWYMGYADQAESNSLRALAISRDADHPFNTMVALGFAARRCQFYRSTEATHKWTEAASTIGEEYGFSFPLAVTTMLRGWARAEQGYPEEGIAQLQQGLFSYHAMGAKLSLPYYLTLLADAYSKGGQIENALHTLRDALACAESTGEVWWMPEIHRLKGELTLRSSVQGLAFSVKEAEECFLKAVEIAQRQQAKSLELRAATSLARLWQQQGKSAEAHDLLAPVYNWFTEGFDTKDLQEAKALLSELEKPKRKKRMTLKKSRDEEEVDKVVIAQADNESAWTKTIQARRPKSTLQKVK
jgi:tetratricopeptide (TPR) repeat protein